MRDSFDTVRSLKYRNARQRNNAKKMEKQQQLHTGASVSLSSPKDQEATTASVALDETTATAMEEASRDEVDDGACGGGLGAIHSPTGFFLKPPLVESIDGEEVQELAEVLGTHTFFHCCRS